MTRSELVAALAKRFSKLKVDDVELAVKCILQSIENQLSKGGRIQIDNFGSFNLKKHSARQVKNPKTGVVSHVPEKYLPEFRAAPKLCQYFNQEAISDFHIPREPSINLGGRPSTNGVLSIEHFLKANIACEAFNSARHAGEKYEFALENAVNAVHAFDPKMKVSPTFVKRILKEWMPENNEEIIRITKILDPDLPIAPNSPSRISYAIGFAPKPIFAHPSKRKNQRNIKGGGFLN